MHLFLTIGDAEFYSGALICFYHVNKFAKVKKTMEIIFSFVHRYLETEVHVFFSSFAKANKTINKKNLQLVI